MYLKDKLNNYKDKKIIIYVDMDGVIADYDVGLPLKYDQKRPLITSITKLEEVNKLDNIELHILSITRMNSGIEEKNIWLDKYASFFKKENRHIISREQNNYKKSSLLKLEFLNSINIDDNIIVLIDDDPEILDIIKDNNPKIVLFKDTVLVD